MTASKVNWKGVRVWYSATHRFTKVSHIAAHGNQGGRLVFRCGRQVYKNNKDYKLFDWERTVTPIEPSCPHCQRWRKYDLGEANDITEDQKSPAKVSETEDNGA
jgi:hypothetical protein